MSTKKKEDKEEKKAKKTVSKKSAASKPAKEKHVAKASKSAHSKIAKEKPAKKSETVTSASDAQVSENELMSKVQCYNHGKKTICAHLILATHKCTAKRIAPDRLATVRIGKKRRCEFYEETTFSK
ncbi:hypothetical protein K1X84_05980 [bacterium]|nr:hypothetical protein [bacterium]